MATFLKFNYRNHEKTAAVNYSTAFDKLSKGKGYILSKPKKKIIKGTMNVTDLWGDSTMQEVIGQPAFPKDRLKILKMYENGGAFKTFTT